MRRMLTGSEARWRDALARYQDTIQEWQHRPWRELPTIEILDQASQILGVAIEYYGALVSGAIPAAWISEGLFTAIYDRLIKRKDDPPAVTYLLGFDNAPILAEKALFDLAQWAGTHASLANFLVDTPVARLASQQEVPLGVGAEDWHEWQMRFHSYLERHGATIYDLDFAKPTPACDPAPVLETFKLFVQGQASDPHARQQVAAERRTQAMQATQARLKGWRLRAFDRSVKWAQKYAPQREDGLAYVGLGYPLIRQMLLEVGCRLVRTEAIQEAEDVFWLPESQLSGTAAALDRGDPIAPMIDEVRQNRALWQAQKQITPPLSLPLLPQFLRRWLPASMGGRIEAGRATGDGRRRTIRGTACSPGTVTATARVMHGPEDFGQMRPGDVLVAAITTPAWTPLFAMASAIVTDVGGPLSHGSIVAREYGIPAVLGTGFATRSIETGDLVRVDGRQGSVEILEKRQS
jgi:phosphohistidine swiveling domain-containing protein